VNTRKVLISLLVVALLVVYYLLGTGYLKQRQAHTGLTAQVADAGQALAQVVKPPEDLAARLAAAQADLDAARGSLPARPSSTQLVNTILRIADACHVQAIPLTTQPWTEDSAGDYSYAVFRLSIAATGTFADLVTFANRLEDGEIPTLFIESLGVSHDTSGEGGTTLDAMPITAQLGLAIYTRP